MKTQEPLSVGVFDDLDKAERSIDELRAHGFRTGEIGIIGHVDGESEQVSAPLSMKMPERNAMLGMWNGGLMGATIGVLVLIVIPGLAEVAGAGRWFELLGGAVLGAAIGGCFIAFGSFFLSRDKSRMYKTELEKGRFIVTVSNPRRQHEAMSILGHEARHAERNT